MMMKIASSSEFRKLIENKVVALVGPAGYMFESSLGREIDDCDLIIRINRSYESIEKHSKDIGEKTDILYSCLIEKPANAGELNLKKLKKCGIKFICAPPASNYKGISDKTKFHDMVNVNKMAHIAREIPIRIVEHEVHTQLALAVECRPNTGFLAIYDLLNYNIKKLKVFGFSFYLDGFMKAVKSGIEGEQHVTEEQFAHKCFTSKRHVQKNMWAYAKKTLRNNPKVELDSVLTKILNLDTLNRKNSIEEIK